MGIREWFDRWIVKRKLTRGRCAACGTILRDAETTGFCSDECARYWQIDTAY